MADKVYWHPETEKDLEKLSEEKQKLIKQRVKEFSRQGTSYRYFGRVTVEDHSFDMYKLKVKESEPFEINQRVIIDIYHGSWIIWGVKNREEVYGSEFIEQVMERRY
jgi:mRNA-degrading endonuclease RelE of RelBE toxin-antitoxin system